MNDIDLDELERLANSVERISPGIWEVPEEGNPRYDWGHVIDLDGNEVCLCERRWDLAESEEEEPQIPEDQRVRSAYIAAIHPGTTKALIARIRELEAQVAYPPVGTCAECSHWGEPWEEKEGDTLTCTMMNTGPSVDGDRERDDTLAKGYGNMDAEWGWVKTKSSFSCCMFERKEK